MEVNVPVELAKAIGFKALAAYDLKQETYSWRKVAPLSLRAFKPDQLEKLRDLAKPHTKIRGAGALVRDIEMWLAVRAGDKEAKSRSAKQFYHYAIEYLRKRPGQRVFQRNDVHGDAWLCFYVSSISYEPPRTERNWSSPEHTNLRLVWDELGGRQERTVAFYCDDVRSFTVAEALAKKGLLIETPEMRERYLGEMERFRELHDKIGMQLLAAGVGTDDLDGNNKDSDRGWWHNRTNRILLEKDGALARVVVDVFRESDKEERERGVRVDQWFWSNADRGVEEDDSDDVDGADEEPPVIEVPTHPYVACFDLRRHMRLRIHISYLTPYAYDTSLADRLVLPDEVKELVEMLLANKPGFRDIVGGKSGGAIVMCAGRPGTGKTLTAEVYAESKGRPLYSVQASQLGVTPEALEDELLKVFARAQRWNAILLIDEADVYVRQRGDDLQQNAIVGVLLRVLEYYNGVLFLTTNRADMVDDAVASRCLARIEYGVPTPMEQARIWHVLSGASGIKVSQATIAKITAQFPHLSGRDVKNLLKLAGMVSSARGEKITSKTIAYVKKFKPTRDPEAT